MFFDEWSDIVEKRIGRRLLSLPLCNWTEDELSSYIKIEKEFGMNTNICGQVFSEQLRRYEFDANYDFGKSSISKRYRK